MRSGAVSIAVAVLTMLVLFVLGLSYAAMMAVEGRVVNATADGYRAYMLAEAGVERGLGRIRNDTAGEVVATVSFDGISAEGNAIRPEEALAYDVVESGINFASLASTQNVVVFNFQQTLNFRRGTVEALPILSLEIGARVRRTPGAASPDLILEYTTDNFATVGPTNGTFSITNEAYQIFTVDITSDQPWTFEAVNDADFRIRATRSGSGPPVHVDYLFIQVTYGVDASTEPWFTPLTAVPLGGGTLDRVAIEDEAGKVNVNYASEILMTNVFQEAGINPVRAAAIAADIIDYRTVSGTGFAPFFTLEELFQLANGLDPVTEYNLIRDYITVYSYVNPDALDPVDSRAPLNINTASAEALRAVFTGLALAAGDPTTLANEILTTRATTPFTCFHSSDPNITSDFYDFVGGRAYLDATEQRNVLNNADATNRNWGTGASIGTITTEFSYESNAFRVRSRVVYRSARREITTLFHDTGSLRVPSNGTINPGTGSVYWLETYP